MDFSRFLVEFRSSQAQTNQKLVSSIGDGIKSGLESMVSPLTEAINSSTDSTREALFAVNENIRGVGDFLQDLLEQQGGLSEIVEDSSDEQLKQEAAFQADAEAEKERSAALKESDDIDPDEDGKFGELAKKLKEQTSGIFGGLKGILFGTAGIFAGIYLFIAALGNEKFRNVVFGAVDAVKQAFGDFNSLINGEMGLMEFLKENALTVAAITAILMPAKTFGLLLSAVKFLPAAFKALSVAFAVMKNTFMLSILPILGPIILVVGAVSAVLFSLKKGFDDFKAKLDETGDIKTALLFGVSSFVGTLIALPATLFKTMIDGVLGLLEFITFGFLDFDDIQQKIRDLDFGGIMRDTIFNTLVNVGNYIKNTVLNAKQFLVDLGVKLGTFTSDLVSDIVTFIKGIGKKIYDPETGAIFGKVLPPFPSLGDIGTFLKEKAKTIYDPDTNAIFGYQLPKLPSISDMFNVLAEFGKKIYDPETGAIFGFTLPSLSDLNPLKNFSLPTFGDDSFEDLQEDADNAAKKAAKQAQKADDKLAKFEETGNDRFLKDYERLSQDAIELQEKAGNLQYQALMKKMQENGELTDAERQFIQQINVVNGGDSVSQSSSTGFSTKKSAQNDDYTVQALAGSMP